MGAHILPHILRGQQTRQKGNILREINFGKFEVTLTNFFLPFFQDEEEWEWRTRDELIHPSDRRRIIHVRVPRRSSGQNGHTSCENAYAGGASRLIRTTPTQSAL